MGHHGSRLQQARIQMRTAVAVALAISALVSAACGSDSHARTEQTVDLSKLDTGSFQTTPRDFVPENQTRMARTVEALRLGNVMPLPSEIDPGLTHNAYGAHVLLKGDVFGGFFSVDHFEADTPGFIAGFATAAKTTPSAGLYSLNDAVMIFDSDADATSAANTLAHRGFNLNADERAEVAEMPSNKDPNHRLIWDSKKQLLASWYPTGRFVIFTLIQNPESYYLQTYWNAGADPAPVSLVDKAIDVTVDRLKSFQATPPGKIADLPVDPDGMLGLTLPRPEGDQTRDAFTGTLDRHGALHDEDDPNVSRGRFDEAGIDLVSFGAGKLVRTRDAAAAQSYLDTAFVDRFRHPIDPPSGLPNARCVKYSGPDANQSLFTCHVAFDRYVASVGSSQLQDAYQRISAQYAILANKK